MFPVSPFGYHNLPFVYSTDASGEFCNFPTVLIGVTENRIDISIAVYIGDIHVTKLLTLDATSGFLASDNIFRLARVFVALSACRKDLTFYYDKIEQRNVPKLSSLFPKPTPMDPSDSLSVLTYKQFLSRADQPALVLAGLRNTTTAMYIAALDGTEKEVIVKFTPVIMKRHIIFSLALGLHPSYTFVGASSGAYTWLLWTAWMGNPFGRSKRTRRPFPLSF